MTNDLMREAMIESMCLTWRHDFGLDRPPGASICSGMTEQERDALRRDMGQIFDHHIGPAIERAYAAGMERAAQIAETAVSSADGWANAQRAVTAAAIRAEIPKGGNE